MSFKELKAEVEELTPEDQFQLAAYLQHLRQKSDPAYLAKLKAADQAISAGNCVTLEQLRKLVELMDQNGL